MCRPSGGVVPLDRITNAPAPVTIEMRREGDHVTVHYGTGGEEPDTLLRLAYSPPGLPARAGIMCASPDGKGFTARFTGLRLGSQLSPRPVGP